MGEWRHDHAHVIFRETKYIARRIGLKITRYMYSSNSCTTSTRYVSSFPPRTALGYGDDRILNSDGDRFKVQLLEKILSTQKLEDAEKAQG